MSDGPQKPFLFLSYASADRARATQVAVELEEAGIPVWIDRTGVSAGSAWAEEIVSAVRRCSGLVVLCSAAAIASRNVRQELQLAWDSDRPILPVILEQVEFPDAISYFLQGRQWIDATDRPQQEWLEELEGAATRLGIRRGEHISPLAIEGRIDLPVPSGPLIGRDREVEGVVALLSNGSRLVTLTGPGGVGKTRLALEGARRAATLFSDGAVFVDLSPVTNAGLVASVIAQVFAIHESGERSIRETLRIALHNRQLLLVLDNFEQVIDAAPVVAELLAGAPELQILVTSREVLRVRGEHEVAVQTLELPIDSETIDVSSVATVPSVALFVLTAQAAVPGFALTEDTAPAVAEICRRLDGLPLAIELAASRVKHFPASLLRERLERRLPVLTGGPRDLPARQQTLRHTIAWSYDLLSPDEQALFRRIGSFPGGASLTALDTYAKVAEALELDLLSGLASLVDKSLVRERTVAGQAPRFSMLETIREFAGEMVVQTGELETSRRAIVVWSLEFVSSGKGGMFAWLWGPANLEQVDEEIDNVRLGFDIAADRGDAESCALMFVDMYGYLYLRGLFREAAAMGRKVLQLAETTTIPDYLRGRTLTDLSVMQFEAKDAEQLAREGLALTQLASDDAIHTIDALGGVVVAIREQGRYAEALAYAEQADALSSTQEGEPWSGQTKYFIGSLSYLLDDQGRAIEYLRESMNLSLGNEFAVYSGNGLVDAYVRRGELLEAAATLRLVVRLWQEAGSGAIGRPLEGAPALAAASHRPEVAAMLFAANSAQNVLFGMRDRDDRWTIEAKEAVQAQLGDEAFESASLEGQALSLEAAVAVVLDLIDGIEKVSADDGHAR